MSFADSLGTFAGDFTQHSLVFLHFVALMLKFIDPAVRSGVFVQG
jgi:hypothetical protein